MSELPSSSTESSILGRPSGIQDPGKIEDILNQEDDVVDEGKGPKKTDDKIDLTETEEDDEKLDLDDKKGKKDKTDKEEDEDKNEEDEDEETDKTKEKDEDLEIDAPPRKKEIETYAPGIFKKFPFLEKMMFRDKAYTEMFGSFEDAKEVAGKVEVVNRWEKELLAGDLSNILKTVKEADPKAYDKTVDNYLINLAKVDKDAYFEVVGNIGKRMIMEMVADAKKSNNDALREAALQLNKFLFNTEEFEGIKVRVGKEDDTKENEVEKERKQFLQERFDIARNDVQAKVDNILRATINEHIDKNGRMTPYVKKNAVKEALDEIHSVLNQDSNLTKTMDKLWRDALNNKFNPESLKRIQSAYLGKAKVNLVNVIKKVRAEALKDSTTPRANAQEEEVEEVTPRRGSQNAGRPSQQRSGDKDGIRKGESITEFFDR